MAPRLTTGASSVPVGLDCQRGWQDQGQIDDTTMGVLEVIYNAVKAEAR